MRDFPKRLATADDIRNCKALVDSGAFEAGQLLEAIERLESRNYLHCPVQEVSEDRKHITIMYCAEAMSGTKAIVSGKTVTINSVTHQEGEPDDEGRTQFERTVLTVSAVVASDAEFADVTAPVTIYESLGMTAEELNQIKEDLSNE